MAPVLQLALVFSAPAIAPAFVHVGAFRGPVSGSTVGRAAGSFTSSNPFIAQKAACAREVAFRPWSIAPLAAESTVVDAHFTSEVAPLGNSSVKITLDIEGKTTQLCYDRAIRDLSKKAGNNIPGFSVGKNKRIPDNVIVNFFGVEEIKASALQIITDSVIDKAIKGIRGKPIGSAELIQDPEVLMQLYNPGEPLMLEVKVDMWPEVKMTGLLTGMTVTAVEPPLDVDRCGAAMKSLQERYMELGDTPEGYEAQMGDSVLADMSPFEELPDGSKGGSLPAIASGEGLDIVLESGRYMPGLAEGLVGAKAGDVREIRVTFPDRMGKAGAELEGKKAIFEVHCHAVKSRSLPELSDEFAGNIRKGLTLAELEEEVQTAVMEETGTSKKDARNRALEDALLSVSEVDVPETLIIEEARQKFAVMMTEMKDQGEDEEKIKAMITKENFEKYVEVVRKNVNRSLSLGLIFTHVAEKEGLEVDQREVVDQMDLIRAEAKGAEIDEKAALDKVEASIQRDMVLNWVADRTTVTWVDPEPVEEIPIESLPVV